MPDVEAAALDAFLSSVDRRALRMAQVVTADRDSALDVVQDAMLGFVRRYATRPAPEWRPLFYRCLQNRLRDWQRRQWIQRRLFFRPAAVAEDDGAEEPACPEVADESAVEGARQLQREQTLGQLEQALRALPGRQREAFELRIWEGLDVRETAMTMGCSEGSVKTHLSRALENLRARLHGTWP